ncbi:MAG: NUDIX domain-containing protein [Nanoarchaeota archaeon]|nr:NUDIX domain-containing protein [Nanoarchaeota archaeon]
MELLYHVTDADEVLGPIDRDKAHKEERLHRTGMVFVKNTAGKYFIVRRAAKPTFPNCYDSPVSFHVVFGETYDDAAHREYKEETGLDTDLQFIGKFRHYDPPERQIVSVYLAITDEEPRLDVHEAVSGAWYTERDVREIIASGDVTPWLRDGFRLVTAR